MPLEDSFSPEPRASGETPTGGTWGSEKPKATATAAPRSARAPLSNARKQEECRLVVERCRRLGEAGAEGAPGEGVSAAGDDAAPGSSVVGRGVLAAPVVGIDGLIHAFRREFLRAMEPSFLPGGWNVEGKTTRAFG